MCCLDDFNDKKGDCSIASALSTEIATGYDVAWVSIGGNDYMDKSCALDSATIQSRLVIVMNKIKASSNFSATAKILMTNYVIPQSAPTSACTTPALVTGLGTAIKAACASESRCTFIDAATLGKGSTSTWSTESHMFVDPIHLG